VSADPPAAAAPEPPTEVPVALIRFLVLCRIRHNDNNLAEQDIRGVKIRQKISGCLRIMTGAQIFCRLRSYLATARNQQHGALDVLRRLHQGHPWLPEPRPRLKHLSSYPSPLLTVGLVRVQGDRGARRGGVVALCSGPAGFGPARRTSAKARWSLTSTSWERACRSRRLNVLMGPRVRHSPGSWPQADNSSYVVVYPSGRTCG